MIRFLTGRVFRLAADIVTFVVAVTIAVLTLSHLPEGSLPGDLDKAAHAAAFFALVFPAVLAHRRGYLWMVPLAIAFGWGIELIQPHFGRGREVADFYADLIGIAAGTISALLIRALRRK